MVCTFVARLLLASSFGGVVVFLYSPREYLQGGEGLNSAREGERGVYNPIPSR